MIITITDSCYYYYYYNYYCNYNEKDLTEENFYFFNRLYSKKKKF